MPISMSLTYIHSRIIRVIDPEASQSGDSVTSAGIDSGVYPTPRTYTLGVKVAF